MESDLKSLNSLRIAQLDTDDDDDDDDGNDNPSNSVEIDEGPEEEDEVEAAVTLGFVEKPQNPNSLLRHFFPSKAGGVPAWLDPVNLPAAKSRTCGFCGEPLQFLLQIYAPISEKEFTFHRMLYVFICPSMSCLLKDQHEQWKRSAENPLRSVRVFRCQLPRLNPFYSAEPPKLDGSHKPLRPGVALCFWCGTWMGDKVCSGCRKARYCSQKHQSLHWQSNHKSHCRDDVNPSQVPVSLGNAACGTLWPEFEIEVEDECSFDSDLPEDTSCATSLAPSMSKTDEAYQSLSEKFEADCDKESWASFQQRIAKAPEQVLRYCRDLPAKPLWPLSIGRPTTADIPKCNNCKGPLGYEFQIMPQLLYYFGVKNDPDSLDWGTIVIFTCSGSCESSISYKEEFAWVQLYPAGAIP